MSDWTTRLMQGQRLPPVLATFALGGLGGFVGWWIGLPLGVLLGALAAVALAATLQVRFFGGPPGAPPKWRFAMIPIVGVAIGGSVPADVLDQMRLWWPTLLALLVFVPLAHLASYLLYRRLGRIDPVTAFFAAMPGGYIEALELGEEHGAEVQMLLMLQFLRLILCIVLVPLGFALATGHAVGSGAGVSLPGAEAPIGMTDVFWLGLAAIGGFFGARALRFPAAILSGPLFLSGLFHALGLTEAVPPDWMITMAQWAVGTTLGARFVGLQPARLWLAMRLSLVAILASMAIALTLALLLSQPVGEPVAAVVLAFAPGGISEMALVAISLKLSAVYVTLHHLVRIVLAVLVARVGMRILPKG